LLFLFFAQDIAHVTERNLSASSMSRFSYLVGRFSDVHLWPGLRVPRGEAVPEYWTRPALRSTLDAFKPYIEERAGVWNAQVLLRELRARGYAGGYTILKSWLHPQRESAPGRQAQANCGHLGTIEIDRHERRLNDFTFTLGYSRVIMAEAAGSSEGHSIRSGTERQEASACRIAST
jgi:hypothetical protein